MRRSFAVSAIAAMALAVMCCSAWAANYSMNIDHNTVSFLTKDYKAQYGSDATMFGFINCRHIHDDSNPIGVHLDPSTFTNGSISITPKQSVMINYVGRIIQGVSYEGRLNSVLGTETISTSKTFQFKQEAGDYGVSPVNDKGWHPIFTDGAEAALSEASYSINVDGKASTQKFEKILTTAEQLATKYVPYVELELDTTGKYAEGITWRPVDAKDPSKAAPNDPNDPRYEGLWGNYSKYSPSPMFYLRVKLYLKDGTMAWFGQNTYSFSGLSGSETFKSPIALSDIACITFDDDSNWYWIFYPERNIEPSKYDGKVSGGTSKTWSGRGKLVITIDVVFDSFLRILIDGVLLDPRYYTAKSGSTIIEIDEAYLKTLGKGTHKLSVEFTDGTAEIALKTNGESGDADASDGVCAAGTLAPLALAILALRKRGK